MGFHHFGYADEEILAIANRAVFSELIVVGIVHDTAEEAGSEVGRDAVGLLFCVRCVVGARAPVSQPVAEEPVAGADPVGRVQHSLGQYELGGDVAFHCAVGVVVDIQEVLGTSAREHGEGKDEDIFIVHFHIER